MKTFKGYINKTIYKVELNPDMTKRDVEVYLDDLIDVITNELEDTPLTITVSESSDES